MAMRALSTEWLAGWRPAKRTELGDREVRGLRVRGGPSGAVTFWIYTREPDPETGVERRKGVNLGRWSETPGPGLVTLAEARAAATTRRAAKLAAPRQGINVGALAAAYRRDQLDDQERGDEAFAIIKTHVLAVQPDPKRPNFAEWPAAGVTRADLAALVRVAKAPRLVGNRRIGGPGAARVVLRHLVAMFAHGVEAGLLDASPAAGMKRQTFKLKSGGRSRFLKADELAALFAAIDLNALLAGGAKPARLTVSTRLAMAALLYTAVRTGSLLSARWQNVDLEAGTWTIPVADLKLTKDARKEAKALVVPLCATALEVFKRLKEEAGKAEWVVASPLLPPPKGPGESEEKPRKRLEDKAVVRALRRLQTSGRLKLEPPATVHDLRRTWRTWAGELGVPVDLAEKALGHVAANQAAGFSAAADIYDRSDRLDSRREAMELVGAAFDRVRLGTSAKVVPMKQGRGRKVRAAK